MKKLFLLLLLTPLFFAACSSDDDKDDNKVTIVVESEAISYNTIKLSWTKIADAYRYQVFFKAEGASEWQTSNSLMPIDQSTTVIFEQSYFNPDTKYTMVVKAFRDSSDNSVIGESKEFTVTTLKTYAESIVGTWNFVSAEPEITVSNQQIAKEIEDKIKEDVEFSNVLTFTNDGAIKGMFSDGDGTYSVSGDIITFTYKESGKELTASNKIAISGDTLIIFDDHTSNYKDDYPTVEKVILKLTYKRK